MNDNRYVAKYGTQAVGLRRKAYGSPDAVDLVNEAEQAIVDGASTFVAACLERAAEILPELDNPKLEASLRQRIAAIEAVLPPSFVGPFPSPNRY